MDLLTQIRADFPILSQKVNGKPLVYLDNGATVQKPQVVLDAIQEYYTRINANIHRGVHTLSQVATDAYEVSREAFKAHLNAAESAEVIFTSGTTFGINLVAHGFGEILSKGDEIIISHLEHHSNIVPWQFAAERSGATLRVIPICADGSLDMQAYKELVNANTKVVAVNHISNSLGTINPVKEIIEIAHAVGAAVLIDGAQAVPHLRPDVQDLDCDFYVFSGHKMYGPTGTGILYGKRAWLEKLPPYQGGGDMIKEVRFDQTTYAEIPFKFEAGTPNIAGAIVMKTALDYMNQIGFEVIQKLENELRDYATEQLQTITGLRIYGTAPQKTSVISFNLEQIHPYDVGALLDKMGIAVRTGHHCTQPIMQFFDIPGTIRASFAFYNTKEEVDALVAGVKKAQLMLA